MDLKFEFRHENLSIVELHSKGIRNTKWLEEVILGDSFWDLEDYENENLIFATGFTKEMVGLVIVFRLDRDFTIITLDAKKAILDEIKYNFCKHCK